jgi:hypothetical protein
MYPPREASELAVAFQRLRARSLSPRADYRTPWESHASATSLIEYERDHLQKSVRHMRALGWMR